MKYAIYIGFFMLLCSFASADWTDGRQVHMKFENNVSDEEGNINSATYPNADYGLETECYDGYCLEFDSHYENDATKVVDLNDGGDYFNSTDGTICVWEKSDDYTVSNAKIYGNRETTIQNYISDLILKDGSFRQNIYDGVSETAITGTTVVEDGNWHFLCSQWGLEGRKIYVDGVLNGTNADTDVWTGVPHDFYIGTGIVAAAHYSHKGHLDEFSYWNRYLNASEIGDAYINASFVVSLDYPVNGSAFRGDYLGYINITYINAPGPVVCTLNDSRWSSYTNSTGLRSFLNNTVITEDVVRFSYGCLDVVRGFWSNGTGAIFTKYGALDISFYDQTADTMINDATIDVSLFYDDVESQYQTSNGTLNISSLPPGTYEIQYNASGYAPNKYFLTILSNKKTTVSLYLVEENVTSTIQYFILSNADLSPVDAATVGLYRAYSGEYEIVAQATTDFVGSVFFDQDTTEEYKLQISKTGYETKTTNKYTSSTTNSPYTIFISLDSTQEYQNIFDFLEYYVSPSGGVQPYDNLTINFSVQSASNSIVSFNFSTVLDGAPYGGSSTLAGGDLITDTIVINNSHKGGDIAVDFFIVYDGQSGEVTHNFQRHYLISNINDSINITLSDSIIALESHINDTYSLADLIKIVIAVLVISMLIYVLYRGGVTSKFAAAAGVLLLIPAARYGFIPWIYAVLGNFLYFFYILMTSRDVL